MLNNAFGDGSADAAIAAPFPDVQLIRGAPNLGVAGGYNAAAELARGRQSRS